MVSFEINKVHEKLINCLLFLYVFSLVLSYTELSSLTNISKFIIQIFVIFIELPRIDMRKYYLMWPLVLSLVVLPLFISITGIYSISMSKVIAFIFYFLLTLFFWIALINCYLDKLGDFINIWYFTLNITFCLLFFIYKGISLNISYLINAMLTNQRYGGNILIQRYGMGFNNVNTFALFASLLIVCSAFELINKKFITLAIIDILTGILFILNAESRTPLVALGLMFLVWIIQKIKCDGLKQVLNSLILISGIIFTAFFIWLLFSGSSSSLYSLIDSITSSRLTFGNIALNSIKDNLYSLLFGVGPMNTSYITESLFGGSISLDNSIEYFLYTVGIVGLIIIAAFFIWLVYRTCKNDGKNVDFIRALVCYLVVYSFFENCIFIPGSPICLFCIVILFIHLLSPYEKPISQGVQ